MNVHKVKCSNRGPQRPRERPGEDDRSRELHGEVAQFDSVERGGRLEWYVKAVRTIDIGGIDRNVYPLTNKLFAEVYAGDRCCAIPRGDARGYMQDFQRFEAKSDLSHRV